MLKKVAKGTPETKGYQLMANYMLGFRLTNGNLAWTCPTACFCGPWCGSPPSTTSSSHPQSESKLPESARLALAKAVQGEAEEQLSFWCRQGGTSANPRDSATWMPSSQPHRQLNGRLAAHWPNSTWMVERRHSDPAQTPSSPKRPWGQSQTFSRPDPNSSWWTHLPSRHHVFQGHLWLPRRNNVLARLGQLLAQKGVSPAKTEEPCPWCHLWPGRSKTLQQNALQGPRVGPLCEWAGSP